MATIKTRPTDADVTAFLDAVPNARRRAEGHAIRALMERVTGAPAVMWGPSMVGFGSTPYTNTLGTNDWPVVAFSPRRDALTLYGVHDGYGPPEPLFDALGPHSLSRGCLYITRLDAVDPAVLEQLVRQAWERGS
ncbi:DUF1801 domain-containing protein [Protaetiibacter larvae]|uniref:DUF1801 domain-containing protein n=1 Tax=Protaetiibacter larvae TaxID=2592654 RepID=A0A5C1Y7I5_9MICO|nr:DUF1801 domain-containing protein [Protaetiibacter larvae]QEO09135.1 DUF1801 domain-containing protein [Protaetiibacter larvae]